MKTVYGQSTRVSIMKCSRVVFCVIILVVIFFNFPFQSLQNDQNKEMILKEEYLIKMEERYLINRNKMEEYLINRNKTVKAETKKSRLTYLRKISRKQMAIVDEYCKMNNLSHIKYVLSHDAMDDGTNADLLNLHKHLLYVNSRKCLCCFIPKVGSTNLRLFMLVLSGISPAKAAHSDVNRKMLKSGSAELKILNLHNSVRFKHFWKFVFLRNPLERLVSAFHDKILTPNGTQEKKWISSILHKYRTHTVDFEMYLRWIVDTPNKKLNEHFAPMIELMQPCRVRYNFYGNFKTLSDDMKMITDKLNVPYEYYRNEGRVHNKTGDLLKDYYSKVSLKVKKALYKDFHNELEFYFNLFPEDRNTLKLLEVS